MWGRYEVPREQEGTTRSSSASLRQLRHIQATVASACPAELGWRKVNREQNPQELLHVDVFRGDRGREHHTSRSRAMSDCPPSHLVGIRIDGEHVWRKRPPGTPTQLQ